MSRGHGKKKKRVKVNRKQHHEIFQKTIELVSLGETGETVLENGENAFPFSITLPEDAQTSFHHVIAGGIYPEHGTNHTYIVTSNLLTYMSSNKYTQSILII